MNDKSLSIKIIYLLFCMICKNFYTSSSVYYELNFVKELTFQTEIGEVFISDPNVIDITVMSRKRMLITAKSIGTSVIRIKDKTKKILVSSSITVTPALSNIRKWVKELYPGVRIEIISHGKMILLLGKVPSPKLSADIETVVKAFVTNMVKKSNRDQEVKFTVMNKMSIDMAVQVMLKVKVVELSREISKQLGIEWNGSIGQSNGAVINNGFNAGVATNTATLPFSIITGVLNEDAYSTVGNVATKISDSVTNGAITNWSYGNGKIALGITNLLNVLESESVTSILAEPTLVTVSGKTATFTSGGEDGYLVYGISNNGESVSTQFKTYGVNLNFIPTVISENAITIALSQSVSSLNSGSSGGDSGGHVGPSVSDRRVTTKVQLANGQTIAVAGMLRRSVTSTRAKSGLLSNLPIIGELFGNKNAKASETEVVITVTPYIVKPVKEQFFYPMNGISKVHPEDDKVNDNVTVFDKNLGVSKDYNRDEYKIGGGV